MQFVTQNTTPTIIIGPLLDPLGVEYASATVGDLSLSKNGASFAALSGAALLYVANGHYALTVGADDTDTPGHVDITCNLTGYQMPTKELTVIAVGQPAPVHVVSSLPSNQASSFRQSVAENFCNVFLNQGHFEESVVWYETAVTEAEDAVTLKVMPSNTNGKRDQEAHHLADGRTFRCVVPKDPVVVVNNEAVLWSSLFEATFSPALGNWIVRADGTRWGWSHVEDEGTATWTLVFAGGRMDRVGFGKPNSL